MALDPFHDYNVNIQGYPDRTSIPTATQFFKRTVTVKAPVGLPEGETWDAHFFTLPINTTIAATESPNRQVRVDCTNGGQDVEVGMLNVRTQPTGQPSFPTDAFPIIANQETNAYSPTDGNDTSEIRLIAGGFEVHNDTADLYKNGSVTCYSQLNGWSDSTLKLVGPSAGSGLVQTARQPPANRSDATQLIDARTWEARQGCYVPFRLDLESGHGFQPRSNSVPVLKQQESGNGDTWKTCAVAEGIGGPSTSLTTADIIVCPPLGSLDVFNDDFTVLSNGPVNVINFSCSMLSQTGPTSVVSFKILVDGDDLVDRPFHTSAFEKSRSTPSITFSHVVTKKYHTYRVKMTNTGALENAVLGPDSPPSVYPEALTQLSLINPSPIEQLAGGNWMKSNIETTGAYFSGLSPETVLTLDYRFITELAPTTANPSMLAMCSPSPPYDPRALDCYSHCINKVPPGVPVGMNAKGDYWRMVLKAAATVAPYAAPYATLAGPTAGLVANLSNQVLQTVNKKVNSKEAAQKKKPAVQTQTSRKVGPNNTFRK